MRKAEIKQYVNKFNLGGKMVKQNKPARHMQEARPPYLREEGRGTK
jgi:hypothetical protein